MSGARAHTVSILAIVSILFSACPLSAWDGDGKYALGTLHSPKSFAVSSEFMRGEGGFDMVNLGIDMYGIFSGKHEMPGIRAAATRNVILAGRKLAGIDTRVYAGPGVVAGYLRDIDKSFGAMAGFCWTAGIQGSFDKRIDLALDFESDIALFVRKNARFNTLDITFYKLGLTRCFYPRLRIMYRFR